MATNKIIIINGMAMSGKSTFCSMVQEYCETIEHVNAIETSTIDYIKKVARMCGWNGKKTKKSRVFLHDLKVAFEKFNQAPNKETLSDIDEFVNKHPDDINIIFVNIREAESIEQFITLAEKKGYTVMKMKVVNPNVNSNEAPDVAAEIDKTEYDIVIQNVGTLEDLKASAKVFVDELKFDCSL